MAANYYAQVRANVDKASGGGVEERVEVNQRALIDKILARYASAGAVYRELLQNSNDAEATVSEIYFTTSARTEEDAAGGFLEAATLPGSSSASSSSSSSTFSREIVRQVEYRNNGMPFRPQDWSRLKKIAEGNPDESKVGAFGVGAYSMFSICESPMVLSGSQALAFVWKGDSLWTRTIDNPGRPKEDLKWTTFVLKSRDPYPLGSLVEFGEFLCASLTFTKCLNEVRVFVNGKRRMTIQKTQLHEPTVVQIQRNSSWWKKGGAVTASPSGLFSLKDNDALLESLYHVQVILDGEIAAVSARYLSAVAKTKVPAQMMTRMERVTKKKPPSRVEVQVLLSNQTIDESEQQRKHAKNAHRIVQSFAPRMGEGRIFIGFRTSQTTGLAAHVGAPFVPTVEREAIDVQDQTLRVFNLELLEFSGILLRLALEHGMATLGVTYEKGDAERRKLDKKLIFEAIEAEERKKMGNGSSVADTNPSDEGQESVAESTDDEEGSGGMWKFAMFMARGVKSTIVKAVNNVQQLVDDGGGELLHPRDPRPLCPEEMQAVMLMQSFCPRQSTPDHSIGAAIARGFSRCLQDRAPPVLTRSGVVPGDQGRLPNKGIEAFVDEGVIRSILYENAKEYHDVIAQCRKLSLDDLTQSLSTMVLEEAKVIRLFRWWVNFSKIANVSSIRAVELKESVRFVLDGNHKSVAGPMKLQDFDFYVDSDNIPCGGDYSVDDLPMPDSILPRNIQQAVSLRLLKDQSLRVWVSPLPIEIWIDFVCSQHPSMTSGQPEYDTTRLRILSTIFQAYSRRSPNEQRVFGSYCQSIMQDKRCIPFDSTQPTALSADVPSNLYVFSAQLDAFKSVGSESFKKVSDSLRNSGVSEDFLLQIGVRKSVHLDFLFANLSTLQWNDDPKPLIEYLRSATLTSTDVTKLKRTQYLPAENDVTRMFAPSELYLPDGSLRLFPFVRILQWPSDDSLSEKSPNGRFLMGLGMKLLPPILEVLQYISDINDETIRLKGLDFVAKRLGPGGSYETAYNRLARSDRARLKFLPCVIKSPLSGEEQRACYSVLNCVSDRRCGVMGFPTIDLGKEKSKLYGGLFQCVDAPPGESLVQQLLFLVGLSKKALGLANGQKRSEFSVDVMKTFGGIFEYMSTRSSDLKPALIGQLEKEEFIPCVVKGEVHWFRPNTVFFNKNGEEAGDSATSSLFQTVEFSPFLSACGVKSEATIKDIFELMIRDPQAVLAAVKTEQNYLSLLRRVAAHRPFRRVTSEIRNTKFLLAYTSDDASEETRYELAAANEVFIVDNSFFARMFPVRKAPHESGLEDFYSLIGSQYISQAVSKSFDVIGKAKKGTNITRALMERIAERGPLLVSPSVMSRPLVSNAASVLEENNLEVLKAPGIKAIYSFQNSTRSQKTTCCAEQGRFKKNSLIIVDDFDWFDVGYAIGELILARCELQDAFFISTLLEVPLDQLRQRGFPVDRIIKPEPLPEPKPAPVPVQVREPKEATVDDPSIASQHVATNSSSHKTEVQPNGESQAAASASSIVGDDGASADPPMTKNNYTHVLKQMYPDADEKYIADLLGESPDLEKVRSVAEDMAMHGFPKDPSITSDQQVDKAEKTEEPKLPSKVLGSKKLGKAFNGLKSSGFGGLQNRLKQVGAQSPAMGDGMSGGGGMAAPPSGQKGSVPPEADADIQNNMERMLENQVRQSPGVDTRGVQSEERSTAIPEGLDHGNTCEVLPAQDIQPFVVAQGKVKAHNGVRVFSARKHPSSEEFLRLHIDAVESFAVILERLCSACFELPIQSIAIYHDPAGNAIAFNANGGIYCNVRYFYGLHYSKNKHQSSTCYSYWFITLCHELAHNFEHNHSSNHAFYTESYASLYLPKLSKILASLQE